MQTIIAGFVSVVTAALFLGYLAFEINEPALAIVIAIGIAGMTADYVQTIRQGGNRR